MRVSVIIPSYNQARFLRATLESVLSQDYEDREVLVYDGGSTDESVGILRSYGDKIQWVSEKDEGQADAINTGLQRATGDILAYLNSDDIYFPHTLKRVNEYFEAHPGCLALYGDAWHLYEDGSIMEPYYTEPWSYPRLLQICFLCQPAVFWRREVIERFGLFDSTLQFALDYDYWLRVGREVDFHYLEEQYLAGSRLHADTKTMGQRVQAHHEILQVVMRHTTEPPESWLMNLVGVIVEDEKRQKGAQMSERARHALFAQSLLENADIYHVPLRRSILVHLEQTLL